MADLATMKRRAQAIANNTLSPRWVLWTSLGWRIESAKPGSDSVPSFRFNPSPAAVQRANKSEAD